MAEAPSSKVVTASRVRIKRQAGPTRLAYLPAEKDPVVFGVHSEVAERVHSVHADFCPVARSVKRAIEIHTSYELVS